MTVVWVLVTGSRHFWRADVVRVAFDAIEADFGWREPGPHTFCLIHGACPPRPVKVPGVGMVQASADWLAHHEAVRRPHWLIVESERGVVGFPAPWDAYRPASGRRGGPAGHIRNAQMVKHLLKQGGPKIVVGFPLVATKQDPKGTTSGTKGCLKLAEKAGLRWWVAPLDMETDVKETV